MPSVRTKFSVGLFVIIGMSLVVIFVLWLGMSEVFKEGRKYVAYFDESVQGLNKDAAVKYRGVNIGRVDQIGVAPDGRLIEIVFTVTKKLKNPDELVAQIKSVGITGIMFVELERIQPGAQAAIPQFQFEPKYPVIITKPSEIKQFLTDLYDILSRMKQVDIEGISTGLTTALDNINQVMVDAEVKKISQGLQKTIENSNAFLNAKQWQNIRRSLNNTAQNLDKLIQETDQAVNKFDDAINESSQNLNSAISEVNNAAKDAARFFNTGSQLVNQADHQMSAYDPHLVRIINNLEKATENLNRLIHQLSVQPSQIIYGAPLPQKPVEPEIGP